MTDRAKLLSTLYRLHEAAEGEEKARLRLEISKVLAARDDETLARIEAAIES